MCNFKGNSCLYVVDIVLRILNCLSMFIIVYNSVRALGTLGPVQTCFRWGVVLLNYASYSSIILISSITLIDERLICVHGKCYTNMFIYRENTRNLPKASELRHSTSKDYLFYYRSTINEKVSQNILILNGLVIDLTMQYILQLYTYSIFNIQYCISFSFITFFKRNFGQRFLATSGLQINIFLGSKCTLS